MNIPDLTTPMWHRSRNVSIIGKIELTTLWTQKSTWIFFVTATAVFVVVYLTKVMEFQSLWNTGPTNDIPTSPRYFLPSLWSWYLGVTAIGAIYLGCNVRAENLQSRIQEVIESRPLTNFDLVSGRLFSIVALMMIPLMFAVILTTVLGYVDLHFSHGYAEPPELWSSLAFLIWDFLPNLAFWGVLAMFLTILCRSRSLGGILVCVCFLGYCFLTLGLPVELIKEPWNVVSVSMYMQATPILPYWILEPLQSFTAAANVPSELAPKFISGFVVVQRVAMLAAVVGLVCIASLLFPRPSIHRKEMLSSGIGCFVLSTVLLSSTSLISGFQISQKEQWQTSHEQLEGTATPDLEHISGSIEIHPAKFVHLDLTLTLKTADKTLPKEVVFTLNPGYAKPLVLLNGTEVEGITFKDGLLTVPWHTQASVVELQITTRGKPNSSFAYLDTEMNLSDLSGKKLRRFRNLGTENAIFHAKHVTLPAGVHWYPTPGVATGRENLTEYTSDFFTFNLQISAPKDWIIAMPGERKVNELKDTTHLVSTSPVSSIALITSKFVQQSMNVEGIEFEMLLSSKHQKMFNQMKGLEIEIKGWLAERLQRARTLGFEYPYQRYTIVEVPSNLRIFGGGWRMESTLATPGVFLLKESGLPSIRWDIYQKNYPEYERRGRHIFYRLLPYLTYDLLGGSPLQPFSRGFLTDQTKPSGPGADALNFVIDQFIAQIVLDQASFFSLPELLTEDMYSVYDDLWHGKEFAGKYFDQQSVWWAAEAVALSDVASLPEFEMRQKVLWHKGYAIIRTLQDVYGTEQLTLLFRNLLEQTRGQTFTFAALANLIPTEYQPLESTIAHLLFSTDAPGYLVTQPTVFRISHETGVEEYLTTFNVYNNEDTGGLIRIYDGYSPVYELEGDGVLTEPIWMEPKQAKTFSLRSDSPFQSLHLKPYFSLNRGHVALNLGRSRDPISEIPESAVPPLVSSSDWQPITPASHVIVVDDLDPGFSIVRSTDRARVPQQLVRPPVLASARDDRPLSYYLPEHPDLIRANVWHRHFTADVGEYRQTSARIKRGRGHTAAQLRADLPRTGTWQLEYYVLGTGYEDRYVRSWYGFQHITEREYPAGGLEITVVHGTQEFSTELKLDPENPNDLGWQVIGEYDILDDEVFVYVSDATIGTKGSTVYVDAIRWTLQDLESSHASRE